MPSDGEEDNKRKLVGELCLIPEVYFVLSELMSSGKPAKKVERRRSADVDDSNYFDECIFAPTNQQPEEGEERGAAQENPLDLASDVLAYFEKTSKIRKEHRADETRRDK